MTDDDDMEDFERRVRTEGPRIAYKTAVAICSNPKAPAPAQATALTALFRVSGWFDKKAEPDVNALDGMTAAELATLRRKMERELKKARANASDETDSDEGGVFG